MGEKRAEPQRAEFIYHREPQKEFVGTDDFQDEEIEESLSDDGANLLTTIQLMAFRPSPKKWRPKHQQRCSLKVDVENVQEYPGLGEILAWSAVEAFVPDANGNLPLQRLSPDKGHIVGGGQPLSIPLVGGNGTWAWNFFLTKRRSVWSKVFDIWREVDDYIVPLMGLSTLATSALDLVNRAVGELKRQSESNCLLQSAAIPIIETKGHWGGKGYPKIPLLPGRWIAVGQDDLSDFLELLEGLKLTKRGLLIERDKDEKDQFNLAPETAEDFSCCTISLGVEEQNIQESQEAGVS